jgi:hypothetical protein
MDRKTWNRVGLAALILLAPGGFVLGASLAARRLRKREAEKAEADDQPVSAPPREAAPTPPGRSGRG